MQISSELDAAVSELERGWLAEREAKERQAAEEERAKRSKQPKPLRFQIPYELFVVGLLVAMVAAGKWLAG